ncbi:MAG: TerB family tellurite resistance protein [Rhizobiaceae bacterium]|nr:TerB family tellurite resistance protein [Rhizobiaceae bacterium]
MFERVLSFLKDLPSGGSSDRSDPDDVRIAVAALLYHVMDADGVRQDVEWDRMKAVLAGHFHVAGRQLDDLVKAGEKADQEAVDLYAFTSVLTRHLDEQARIELIRLMWDVVYADGVLHELEDNTIWRVAELLGVDRRERILAKQEAARRVPGAEGQAADE